MSLKFKFRKLLSDKKQKIQTEKAEWFHHDVPNVTWHPFDANLESVVKRKTHSKRFDIEPELLNSQTKYEIQGFQIKASKIVIERKISHVLCEDIRCRYYGMRWDFPWIRKWTQKIRDFCVLTLLMWQVAHGVLSYLYRGF